MSARNGVNVAHFMRSAVSPAGANEPLLTKGKAIIGSRETKFPQSAAQSLPQGGPPQTKGMDTNKVTVGNGHRPYKSPTGIWKTGKRNHYENQRRSAAFGVVSGAPSLTLYRKLIAQYHFGLPVSW
jgi:hypothetical protein